MGKILQTGYTSFPY